MIKAVVFDLDGTLVDSFEDIAHAANHALGHFGKGPLPLAEIKSHVGHGLRNLLKGLLDTASEEDLDRAVSLVKEYYLEHPTDFTLPYPGALETLDELGDRGIRRAVLSNKLDSLVQRIASGLGFSEKMEEVWGHREDFPLKPDPSSLWEILGKFGVRAEECLVVGDAAPDRLLAKNAGAHFCAVSFGMTDRFSWEKEGVSWCVDSLSDLIGLLESLPVGAED